MGGLETIAVVLSGVAAILAWVAKLRWSREYQNSVKSQLAAKDAQIELLREKSRLLESVTSAKLHELYERTKKQL
ncbi:hypothetical protein ACFL9U_05695 [Thermodesulfobacteriota bacterium]